MGNFIDFNYSQKMKKIIVEHLEFLVKNIKWLRKFTFIRNLARRCDSDWSPVNSPNILKFLFLVCNSNAIIIIIIIIP